MLEEGLSDQRESPSISQLAGNIVFYFGVLVSVLWTMGLPLLWLNGWSTRITRPNSGLGFLLAGLALKLVQENTINDTWRIPELRLRFTVRRTVQVLGTILVVLGLLTLLEYILDENLNIGTLIILQKWMRDIDSSAIRMAPLTAVEFILTGAAFLLLDRRMFNKVFPSEIISTIILTISLDSLIAFLYMSNTLPDIRTDSPMPIVSSLVFLVLSVGILASREDRGMVAVWVAKYNGSMLVRKWLPVGILVFIATGEIVDIMQDSKFVGSGISLSIFTVVVISFIAVVVLFSAVHLNRSERELLHINKLYAVLSQSNQAMVRTKDKRHLLNSICDIMVNYGDFRMSWISMFDNAEKEFRIDACSGEGCKNFGDEAGSLEDFTDSGSARRILETVDFSVFNDIESANLSTPTKLLLTRLGHRSMAVLRLMSFGKIVGMLSVCSAEAGYFKDKEMNLLREVTLDLSFALEGLERERQRERAEKAVLESEEKFRATFERAAVGIVLLTPTGIIMKANPYFCNMTGYSENDLSGRSFLDVTHREDAARDKSRLEAMVNGDISTYSTEKRYIRKDGTPIWAHLSAALVRDANGEPTNLISVVQDISEQKEAEELLRKSREQYQRFFEEDITADFISTVEGEILSCNPAFARIFGFSSVGEAMKSKANDLYLNPRHREEFLQLLQDVKKIEYHEMTLRKKDGSEIYVIRSAYGIFDENGKLIQTRSYLFDDTRRRMLERQVLQTQKMESLGTLAGGIAHDFNNILGIIMGHTGLLKRRDLSQERFSRSLEAIEFATRRGAALIRQLLTFARREERSFEHISVNETINDLYKLLEETFPRLVTIRLDLAAELPLIIGDPNQIHQALLNLCVNARDAMLDRKDGKTPGGTLSLSTALVEGAAIRDMFSQASRDSYVRITVSDTGSGMDDATRSHIFEPFFTTKERGKGTGLGLATVYGIVDGHEGFIDVSSEPGIGTTFAVYLPCQSLDTGEKISTGNYVADIEGGNETILVVEDEEMLTDFLKEILTRKGYKVITAPDGETAVSTFAASFRSIRLVLSDLGLPKLSGADMLEQLRQIDPDVRVIFASGFFEPEWKSEIGGVKDFIQKPYSSVEVLRKVREVLGPKGPAGSR